MIQWRAYLNEARQQLYELTVYGNLRQRKVSLSEFKQDILPSAHFRPIFFLSTGRTGTQLFTQLINCCVSLRAFHTPKPELIQQGKVVYEAYHKTDPFQKELIDRLSGQTFLAAREHYLHQAFLHNKTYVETNNRITFLAPAIHALLPHARFVYLYRHPGDFIRSGIRRRWYTGQVSHDIGRITYGGSAEVQQQWNEWGYIEKIAWLWNETNQFIEDFLSSVDSSSYFKLNFDTLSVRTVISLFDFLDCRLPSKKIAKMINNPVNQQRDGQYPPYEAWPEEDKEKVRSICLLAPAYGYEL